MAVHASLDTLMMLGRCQMALFQCASSFVTGPARRHEQLPIAHPTFASSRAWLADSCGMQKHAGFILNSVAKQLHGTRMATTRIHFGLCATVGRSTGGSCGSLRGAPAERCATTSRSSRRTSAWELGPARFLRRLEGGSPRLHYTRAYSAGGLNRQAQRPRSNGQERFELSLFP